MITLRAIFTVSSLFLLAACSNTMDIFEPRSPAVQPTATVSAPPEAPVPTVVEPSTTATTQSVNGDETQEIAAQEASERAEAARLARVEAERVAREDAAAAQREEQRQRELAQQRATEQAAQVARQQERIAALQSQIRTNYSEVATLETANAALREAVEAAEGLTAALASEQNKYSEIDPVTGETTEGLAKSTLEELSAEVERLREQAAALVREIQ